MDTSAAPLEVFVVNGDGGLNPPPIPVGLEPTTVVARTESQARLVNHLSDTVGIVDLSLGTVVKSGDRIITIAFQMLRSLIRSLRRDGPHALRS